MPWIAALECLFKGFFLGSTIFGAQLGRAHFFDDLHVRIGRIVTRVDGLGHRIGAAIGAAVLRFASACGQGAHGLRP